MKRILVIAALFALLGGHAAADYQPPTVPYSGCISAVYPKPDGSIHETGISCSIVIPMLAVD